MDEPASDPVDPERTGVKAHRVDGYSTSARLGDAWHIADVQRVQFHCPGCGQVNGIFYGEKGWKIEKGDPEDPASLTVSPSIHCIGCCGWHGYLRDGVFQSV